MRLSIGAMIVLALLPLTLSVVGFYSAHFILSAPKRVDWVSLGAPPEGAVEFVDQKSMVRAVDGKLYWPDNNGWSLKSDEALISAWEFDEKCPSVVFPKGTVDEFQECYGYSDDYYAILNDGTLWYYTTGDDNEYRTMQYVGNFIVKVLASIIGLTLGVGIWAIIGLIGRYWPINEEGRV
jgi:hypothetical protein